MMPSERQRAIDRGRKRVKTVVVWKCRRCRATFDAPPHFHLRDSYGEHLGYVYGCPECEADAGWITRTRVED